MKKYKFSLIFTGLLIFGHILVAADESKPVVQTPYAQLKGTPNKGVILTKPEKDSEYSYPSEKYREIYQELLQRPYNFQEECSADLIPIFNAFSETTNILAIIPTGAKQQELFQKYFKKSIEDINLVNNTHRKNPLFFTQECTKCDLQRHANKNSCSKEAILQNILADGPKQGDLDVGFYASGDCFWELELLTRLIENGARLKRVVLIDTQYKNILKDIGSKSVIDKNAVMRTSPVIRKEYLMMIQMLYYLAHHNPNIQVIVYDNSQGYLSDVGADPTLKSHIIYALDYFDYKYDIALKQILDAELDQLFNNAVASGGLLWKVESLSPPIKYVKE